MKNYSRHLSLIKYLSVFLCFIAMNNQAKAQDYFFENFNSSSGANFPAGWTAVNDGVESSAWTVQAPFTYNGNVLTMLGTNYVFSNADAGGSGSVTNVTLTSPVMNTASANLLLLEFDQHYRDYSATTSDSAIVEVSGDGINWQQVQGLVQNVGSGNSPVKAKINITANKSATMRIRFRYVGIWPWYWGFDNVRIFQPVANDVGVSKILISPDTCGFGVSVPVKIQLSNYGSINQTSIPVSYRVNDGTVITETFTGSLAPNETANYTFTTLPAGVLAGVNQVSAWTKKTGDLVFSNDSIVNFTIAAASNDLALVSFEGFTGDNLPQLEPGWAEKSGPTAAVNGSLWRQCDASQTLLFNSTTAAINLYADTRKEWIISPTFKPLSSSSLTYKVAVTNWQNVDPDVMGSDDSVHVMVSTNCGQSWSKLKSYSKADNLGITLLNQSVPLTAYQGQEIKIAFFATDGTVDDIEDYDFHIDNIRVGDVSNIIDLGVLSIEGSGLCGLATLNRFKVSIANIGLGTAQTYSISYRYNGGPISVTNVTTPLAANDTTVIEVPTPQLVPNQPYFFKFWSKNGNDLNFTNDTLRLTLQRDSVFTTNVDFTGFNGNNLATLYPGWTEATKNGTNIVNSSWRAGDVDGQIAARIALTGTNKSDWILSPGVKIVPNSFLTLKAAHLNSVLSAKGVFGDDDSVSVLITTNCGALWKPFITFSKNKPNGIDKILNNYTFSLAEYANPNVETRIGIWVKDGANSAQTSFFFIDDVQISNGINFDVKADSVFFKNNPVVEGQTNTLKVKVSNKGANSINQVKVYVRIGASLDSILIPKIFASQSDTADFINFIPPAAGNLSGYAWVKASGDQVPTNDTTYFNIPILVSNSLVLSNPTAGFKVYPNPAQSTSAIFIEQEHASAGEVEVMLWSLVGQPVYRKTYKSAPASGIQATFQSVPAGIYMIEVVKDGKSLGKKPLVLKD